MAELLEKRISQLNGFSKGMVDLQLSRNPLAQECILIFNKVVRDQYQDAVTVEDCRIKKLCIVHKNIDMNYVQQLTDELLEDSNQIPWLVSLSITDLPRNLSMDDAILIGGKKYSISLVKPMNRSLDYIINFLIYPERSSIDELELHSYRFLYNNVEIKDLTLEPGSYFVLDIVYGGNPLEFSFDDTYWYKFQSKIQLFVKDRVTYQYKDSLIDKNNMQITLRSGDDFIIKSL